MIGIEDGEGVETWIKRKKEGQKKRGLREGGGRGRNKTKI